MSKPQAVLCSCLSLALMTSPAWVYVLLMWGMR